MAPKVPLTIITPLLNRAEMLKDALAGVAAQQVSPVEHIVVDGGSTDGAAELAHSHGAQVLRAPKSSIYEALNLGLHQARGEYICFLNSDDHFAPGAFQVACDALEKDANLDFVKGGTLVSSSDGRWTNAGATPLVEHPTLRSVLFGPANMNACFFRNDFIRRVGLFDERFAISADREWLARGILRGVNATTIPHVLYHYRAHGDSLTIGGRRPSTAKWVAEHIQFAQEMLCAENTTARNRNVIRAFLAKEIFHLVSIRTAEGRFGDAATVLAKGFRSNPSWPLHAIEPVGELLLRRLVNLFTTTSPP